MLVITGILLIMEYRLISSFDSTIHPGIQAEHEKNWQDAEEISALILLEDGPLQTIDDKF